MKVKVKTKEEIKKAEDEKRRHSVGLIESLAKLYPIDFLKVAKKLEKQTV